MPGPSMNSPADDAALRDVQAKIAAGEDPFGDFDDEQNAGANTPGGDGNDGAEGLGDGSDTVHAGDADTLAANVDTIASGNDTMAAAGSGEGEGDDADVLSEEALKAVLADQAPAVLPRYQVPTLPEGTSIEAERAKLKEEQKKVELEWSAGTISDEERIDKLAAISDQRDELLAAQVRSETIASLNHDSERQTQQTVLDNLAAASAKAGEIDYLKDTTASAAFNALLPAIQADPANAGKSYPEIAQATHDALCAARGIQRKPAQGQVQQADSQGKPRTPPPAPVTLRGLPAASTPNTGSDWKDALSKLSGQAFEEAFAKLPQSRKDELLND